ALFEAPVRVYPVATGTAANALALAAASTPFGAIYCSAEAHVNTSECNATAFFGGGTKLVPVDGPHGKVDAQALAEAIAASGKGLAHKSQPAAVNLVQASDLGAVYTREEIEAVCRVAHEHGLKVHLDGARFANALATLGCTPAPGRARLVQDALRLGAVDGVRRGRPLVAAGGAGQRGCSAARRRSPGSGAGKAARPGGGERALRRAGARRPGCAGGGRVSLLP